MIGRLQAAGHGLRVPSVIVLVIVIVIGRFPAPATRHSTPDTRHSPPDTQPATAPNAKAPAHRHWLRPLGICH